MQQPTDRLAGLQPETRALVEQIEAAEPSQKTPEFTRLNEGLVALRVCTSLSDEDATARANLLPPAGFDGDLRWEITTEPKLAPVACANNPDTHRHLVFNC